MSVLHTKSNLIRWLKLLMIPLFIFCIGLSINGAMTQAHAKDPLSSAAQDVATRENHEFIETGSMSKADNAMSRLSSAITGSGASSKDSAYGLSPASLPGSQWSALSGTNGAFGIATKTSDKTSYSTLTARKATYKQGQAAEYGMILYDMGLDHSNQSSIGADPFQRIGRYIGGFLLFIGDIIDSGDYYLFRELMHVFNFFNPVTWLSDAGSTYMGSSVAMAPVFGPIKGWYREAKGVGLVFAAVLGAIGFCLHYFGNGSRIAQSFRPVGTMFKRIFVITVIPLIIVGLFTMVLHSMNGVFSKDGDTASEYAIYSTLIDNKGWIEHSRMQLPAKANYLPFGQNKSIPPATHQLALEINADGAGFAGAQEALQADTSNSTHTSAEQSYQEDKGVGLHDTTTNMIANWFSDAGYDASDFSSYVKAHLPQGAQSDSDKQLAKLYTSKSPKYKNSDATSRPWPYVNNGTLDVQGGKYTNYGESGPSQTAGKDLDPDALGGLSTVGQYNYLLTIFNDKNMNWTDSSSLLNAVSEPEHKVVGMTGTGLNCLGNFALMVMMMLVVGVLGFRLILYDFWTLFRSLPSIFGYAIGNAFGIFSMTWKLCQATAMVLVNLIGTSAVYLIGRQALIGFSQIPDQIFGKAAYNKTGTLIVSLLHSGLGLHLSTAAAYSGGLYSFSCFIMSILLFLIAHALWKAMHALTAAWERFLSNLSKQLLSHNANRKSARSDVNSNGGNSYNQSNSNPNLNSNNNSNSNGLSNVNGGGAGASGAGGGHNSAGIRGASGNNGKSGNGHGGVGNSSGGNNGDSRGDQIKNAGNNGSVTNDNGRNGGNHSNTRNGAGNNISKNGHNGYASNNPLSRQGSRNNMNHNGGRNGSVNHGGSVNSVNNGSVTSTGLNPNSGATGMSQPNGAVNPYADNQQNPGYDGSRPYPYTSLMGDPLRKTGNGDQLVDPKGNTFQGEHGLNGDSYDGYHGNPDGYQTNHAGAIWTKPESDSGSGAQPNSPLSYGDQADEALQNNLHNNMNANGGQRANRFGGNHRHMKHAGLRRSSLNNALRHGQQSRKAMNNKNAVNSNPSRKQYRSANGGGYHGATNVAHQLHGGTNAKNNNIASHASKSLSGLQKAGKAPSSPQAANRGIRGALAEQHAAQHAASALGPNASPVKQRAFGQRVQAANRNLHKARMGSAILHEGRPVGQNMLRAGFHGHRPSNGQVRSALKRVYGAQNTLLHADRLGNSGALKTAGSTLRNADTHAKQLGINPAHFNTHTGTAKALNTMNSNLSNALNGHEPVNTSSVSISSVTGDGSMKAPKAPSMPKMPKMPKMPSGGKGLNHVA